MNIKTVEEEINEKWNAEVVRLAEEALLEEKPEDENGYIDGLQNRRDGDNPYRESAVMSPSNFNNFKPVDITQITEEELNVDWIWEGFIGSGLLTLFAALWKAGKSTFLSYMLQAMQKDSDIAGMKLKNKRVLILSEEGLALWGNRRDELNLQEGIYVASRPLSARLKYREWVEFLRIVADFCKENKIDLLIIDTLAGFWPVINENDASEVGSAMLPFNPMLAEGMAVMLVHHFRKSGGDDGTAARGSGALSSATDINIDFVRLKDAPIDSRQRVIRSHSRFWETPIEVVIELTQDKYETLGALKDVAMEAKLEKAHRFLSLMSEKQGTIKDVYDSWKLNEEKPPSERSIRRYLAKLVDRGFVSIIVTPGRGVATKEIFKIHGDMTTTSLYSVSPSTVPSDLVLSDPPDPEFLKAQRMMLKERSL